MDQDQPIDPDRWVDDHGDALYGYALMRLRDADSAAELVQETFLEALKGRSRFEGRSSERTWLIGILKHKVIDHFRRRSRGERGVGGEDPAGLEVGEFFDEKGDWKLRVDRWAELPERVVERAEFWEVFRACLAELPEKYAEAFTLSELEGLPGPEVCKILDITPTNLWARLHRARLLLRRSLEARWFGEGPGGG
jgi:RNA polymerase sigma-70 factor (ECF subfamily)